MSQCLFFLLDAFVVWDRMHGCACICFSSSREVDFNQRLNRKTRNQPADETKQGIRMEYNDDGDENSTRVIYENDVVDENNVKDDNNEDDGDVDDKQQRRVTF